MKQTMNSLLLVFGMIIAALVGLELYHVTGLHGAVESPLLSVGLGTAIAYWFMLNFRIALFGSSIPRK